ncbi:gamma-glutamyltransferase family protein [Pontibacter sp. HJ8]
MKKILVSLVWLLVVTGCQVEKQSISKKEDFTQTATSDKGIVTAAQPLAMKAGVEMLEKGGNAVDAAVATAFALAVVEPSMSGIGGRLQAIVHLPNGQIRGIDATTQAPVTYNAKTAPKGAYGYATIGIPGTVAGLTKLLEEYGSLTLEEVTAPAIRYAEKGFLLLPKEAARHATEKNLLKKFTGSKQYFLKGDTATYRAGELIIQTDLAQTLKAIAKGGKDAFYKGAIAEKMIADIRANGGVLTLDDLANYEVKEAEILQSNYRGYDVHALSMPSYGAITLEMLNILENLPLGKSTDENWASYLYQAMELSYQDRKKQTQDSIPVLISKPYARQQLSKITQTTEGSSYYRPRQQETLPESWSASMGHTTHLSTADKNGMMVALTQSLGPNMGSRVATPGLGFLYAVTLGGYLGAFEPGQRASSHISPVIIRKDGQPFMALGAAGGSRIPTAVVSVISRVIDQGMSLENALAAPRVHPDMDTVIMEMHTGIAWKRSVIENMQKRGFLVKEDAEEAKFGRVHAIIFDPKKKLFTGGADPDWEGAVGAPVK